MKKYYIDNNDVSHLVSSNYQTSEEKNIAGDDKIMLSTYNMRLFNLGGVFNPYNPQSIFYGRDVYNSVVRIEDEYGLTIHRQSQRI